MSFTTTKNDALDSVPYNVNKIYANVSNNKPDLTFANLILDSAIMDVERVAHDHVAYQQNCHLIDYFNSVSHLWVNKSRSDQKNQDEEHYRDSNHNLATNRTIKNHTEYKDDTP